MASLAWVAPASVAPLRYSPTWLPPVTPDNTELQILPPVFVAGGGGGLDNWAGLGPEVEVWTEEGREDTEAVFEAGDNESGLEATGTVYPQSSEPPPGPTGGAGKLCELTMSFGSSYLEFIIKLSRMNKEILKFLL